MCRLALLIAVFVFPVYIAAVVVVFVDVVVFVEVMVVVMVDL